MKHFTSFFLCISSIVLQAQEWSPLFSNELSSYSLGNSELFTHSIRIDHVEESGSDSLLALNTVIKKCGDCPVITSDYCFDMDSAYFANQPQFLQRYILKDVSGNWLFMDPDTFLIVPHALIGESWIFASGDEEILATVTEIVEIDVIGEMDSVKVIALSNGRQIQLSKMHGLLLFPDTESELDYHLKGIRERGLGQHDLSFEEVFDFNTGDVFFFHSYDGSSEGTSSNLIRRDVVNVVTGVDMVTVDYHETFYSMQGNMWGIFTEYSWENDVTIEYSKDLFWPLNDFKGGAYAYNGTGSITSLGFLENLLLEGLQVSQLRTDSSNGLSSIYFNGNLALVDPETFLYGFTNDSIGYFCKPFEDTDDLSYQEDFGIPTASLSYSKGLGITSRGAWLGLYTTEARLAGAVKDGDTTGIYFDAEEILAMNIHEAPMPLLLRVFPNPATDRITIHTSASGHDSKLEVIDQYGRVVITAPVKSMATDIDVSGLARGLYQLRWINGGNAVSQKLVVN